MIELCRLGLMNWHLLPDRDIDIAGHCGVVGENRSGKSTLLDMIQVVMTGNSGRYRRLNASANDGARKRGQRTVRAYCLGQLSPTETIRAQAKTYLFMVFADAGAKPVTIGIALEASREESGERTLGQFILPGSKLSIDDFKEAAPDGSGDRPRDWALVRPWLESQGARVYRDEPMKFVADYLKVLSTGQRFLAPERVLRAFVNAISFEQIESATDFVRRYVLESRPVRIGQLRESIATYQSVRKNIDEAQDKLNRLKAILEAIDAYKADVERRDSRRWIAGRASLDHQYHENRRLRAMAARAEADRVDAVRDRTEYERLLGETQEDLDAANAALSAQTQGKRQVFDTQRRYEESKRDRAAEMLNQLRTALNQTQPVTRLRGELGAAAQPVVDRIEHIRSASGQAVLPEWPHDLQKLGDLLDDPGLRLEPLRERCRGQAEAAIAERGKLRERRVELTRQRDAIRDKGFSLDPAVERLAAELERMGFGPRILCTLLEVTDENWRLAAEALLGRDREAILVDDAYVEDAIRHLQRHRQQFRGCRIVNTRKIQADDSMPRLGSLASVLRSRDPLAMAFVVRRIGNVRLADTIADLHAPGRAIMRDGTYDDGLVVEMRDVVGGNKIGAGAGRAGLSALEAELNAVVRDLSEQDGLIRDLQAGELALIAILTAVGRGQELARLHEDFYRASENLARIAADLKSLQAGIDPALEERVKAARDDLRRFRIERDDAVDREAEAKSLIQRATQDLASGEGSPGSRHALQLAWRRFRDVAVLRPSGRPAYRAALEATQGDARKLADLAGQEAADAGHRVVRASTSIFNLYAEYQRHFGLRTDLTPDTADPVHDIQPWADQNARRIEEVDLVRYQDQATAAAEQTREQFQNSFVLELRDRFDSLRRIMDEMNRTLALQDFHYERYRFHSQPAEPYRDIIRMVEASRDDNTLFAALFDRDAAKEHEHAKALASVQVLLMDETRDISEFEDYRLYFTFNMLMRDVRKPDREVDLESRRGTGSGAEQQVPFYVAIGTALAAAYHGRDAADARKAKGIGLAVLDEAFTKLDGKNQKACMAYYQRLGLQVIVAAPAEKRATLYETMQSFIDTIRAGDSIEIDASCIGDRTRQAFADANPANLGYEAFRQMRLAAGKADAA
ncbi:MAG TPA: SbcC/MukB-like Walker B domain-containing protein [Rhodopila sp.]|jgi:energy-coupling factor transporter ATP-binding protein EcfA2|nr:SbcC/MukB-like Walker B domain-containing protein [Rhodopila sp.]